MSVDSRITAALKPFGYDVYNGVSLSKNKTYFTFNYTVIPTDYADDDPNHEIDLIQVHLFCPLTTNVTPMKKSVRRRLHAAGFTWASVSDASDENGRHIIFECEDAEGVIVDGNDDDERT